jgi:hypothetical protein
MSEKYIDLMKPEPYDDGDSILTLYRCTVCGKEAPTPTVSHDERLHRIAALQAENARLRERCGAAALACVLENIEEAYHHLYLAIVKDMNLPPEEQARIMSEAIDATKEAKG